MLKKEHKMSEYILTMLEEAANTSHNHKRGAKTIEPRMLTMSGYQACQLSNQCKWPRLMRAKTAAAYVDERSVYAFRRAGGTLWPKPLQVSGKGERWLKDDLDTAIENLTGRKENVRDASDVL